jgi:hypothetical protein
VEPSATAATTCGRVRDTEGVGWRLLADAVMVVHLAFVVFTAAGFLLALRWRRVAFVHVPVVAYGLAIEVLGFRCPLTPLEKSLRRRAGGAGYDGGFVENYVVPVLYPGEWTTTTRLSISGLLLATNAIGYVFVWRRRDVGPRSEPGGDAPGSPDVVDLAGRRDR